ncbi:MAG: hypothetical protein MUC56_14325 [Thermoanaerobaculales bacterium]|jgi:hypothetical protein|nr:hypothetical protein [Thermoanaerobaculales bacterium]
MVTSKLRLDRIASSTRNAHLPAEVLIGPEVIAEEGRILAVRITNEKAVYNQVEDPTGRLIRLRAGDVLAGVLGARRALRGYEGEVPGSLAPGDTVEVLNLGGVLGRCTAGNPDLGPPFTAEVLGAVLTFPRTGDRVGRPATIREGAVPVADELAEGPPIVAVVGTCMDAGKTVAASEVVRGLSRAGLTVAGVKLTGVSLRRDALSMLDAGAVEALTFTDAGVVSTDDAAALPTAYGLLNELARRCRPEVIVAELGDGILGEYGVATLLSDPQLVARLAAVVCCAPDQVGAWGAVEILRTRFGIAPTAISGPATDNAVGCRFIRDRLGLPAANARAGDGALAAIVREAL